MGQYIKDFQVSCNSCHLDTLCLPQGLPKKDIWNLSNLVKNSQVLQQDELIYHQGEHFKGIIAIKSGAAKLVTNDDNGNEHILNILLPGELIGLEGLSQNKHNCSVIALETVSYCTLSPEKIDILGQTTPLMMLKLLKHASHAICDFQNHFFLSKRPAKEKLALFLINLSERLEMRGFSPLSFNIPLTRQETGNYLGLTLETVSRMLQHIQSLGFINVQRKHITINDLKSLKNLCSKKTNNRDIAK